MKWNCGVANQWFIYLSICLFHVDENDYITGSNRPAVSGELMSSLDFGLELLNYKLYAICHTVCNLW